jgi:hypothetical protein
LLGSWSRSDLLGLLVVYVVREARDRRRVQSSNDVVDRDELVAAAVRDVLRVSMAFCISSSVAFSTSITRVRRVFIVLFSSV